MGAETEVDVYYMAADNNDYALEAAAVVQAEEDLKRGPWTVEEDLVLVNYIANHGEGRWNSLARCAGLKRTGKSCRLRWLNYLRPDVRRGNITPEEQLLILDLHSRWGNRWSKIAQHLPGRTDNEIKNYWRTRVQRHAKQLKCDVNSQKFKDVMRHLWMPRLMERIRASSGSSTATANPCAVPVAATAEPVQPVAEGFEYVERSPDNSSTGGSLSDSLVATHLLSPPVSDITIGSYGGADECPAGQMLSGAGSHSESLPNPCGYFNQEFPDFEHSGWGAAADGFSPENLWMDDDFWFLQEQLL